jgi:phosphatidate cytidylyltransferase
MSISRILTAIVILPLLVLYILKLPPIYYAGLLAFASVVALIEFYSMYRITGILKYAGIISGFIIIGEIYLTDEITQVVPISVILIAVLRLLTRKTPTSALSDIAPVVIGLLYIPVLLGYQILIVKAGPELVVFLLGAVWTADAMALYVGKSIGKRKLYESMSPKKTVAGAVASVTGGAGGAAIVKLLIVPYMPLKIALLSGLVLGTVTVFGDLVESMFKRDAGVKDSGSILPGHGGFLDKMDGSLFAGPVLFWILSAFKMIE